jgi:hypothetical protein
MLRCICYSEKREKKQVRFEKKIKTAKEAGAECGKDITSCGFVAVS